eukprot:SAG31_NODE_9992_length_1200_cov_1.349682_1_plen_157_part_10
MRTAFCVPADGFSHVCRVTGNRPASDGDKSSRLLSKELPYWHSCVLRHEVIHCGAQAQRCLNSKIYIQYGRVQTARGRIRVVTEIYRGVIGIEPTVYLIAKPLPRRGADVLVDSLLRVAVTASLTQPNKTGVGVGDVDDAIGALVVVLQKQNKPNSN